jgi:Protein of unknown function (DUF3124)
MKIKKKRQVLIVLVVFMVTGILCGHGIAASMVELLKGQSVYVPIYSHIYHGNNVKPFDLTVTLSIRNTDPKQEITLVKADYFDSHGNLLKNYVEKPIKLKKLASIRYVIKGNDKSGGSGAKFIVKWKSEKPVNVPLIEAIMISTRSGQGISFVSKGQAIVE